MEKPGVGGQAPGTGASDQEPWPSGHRLRTSHLAPRTSHGCPANGELARMLGIGTDGATAMDRGPCPRTNAKPPADGRGLRETVPGTGLFAVARPARTIEQVEGGGLHRSEER